MFLIVYFLFTLYKGNTKVCDVDAVQIFTKYFWIKYIDTGSLLNCGGEFYKPTTILFVLIAGCSFQPMKTEYICFHTPKPDMQTYCTIKSY